MPRKLSLLLVEDNIDDASLITRLIEKEGYLLSYLRIDNAEDMNKALTDNSWDIIISDYAMPGFSGEDALAIYNEANLDIPFILVSGTVGEETAVRLLKSGAHDYIMKDKLSLIVPSISRELEEYKIREERKKAILELNASERRFRELMENMNLIAIILDRNGNIVFCNNFLLNLTGWNHDEIINRDWFEIFIPSDLKIKDVIYSQLPVESTPVYYENEILTKAGKKRIISWSNTILHNPSGGIFGIASIGQDITDKIHFEKQLEASEKLYKSLVETSPDSICMLNMEGMIIFCNQRKADTFGYSSADDLIGTSTYNLISPEYHSNITEIKKQLLTNGSIKSVELKFVRKDGSVFWGELRSTLIFDNQNQPSAVINVVTDIDDRKKMQEAWFESETRFRTAFENAPIGMELISLTGEILRVNKAFCELTGYTNDELEKMNFRDITHPDDLLSNENVVQELKNGTIDVTSFEKRYIRKDSSIIWVFVSATLFRNTQDIPQYFIAQVEDITRRKKAEEDMLLAKNIAEESNRLKSALLVNMSHELRTPMNGVLGFAELIMAADIPQEVKEMVEFISRSGKRLMKTLDSIMTLAQLESGTKPILEKVAEVNISKELTRLTSTYESAIADKNLSLQTDIQNDVYINTEIRLLTYALSKIIDNAVKFTHAGSITITLQAIYQNAEPWISIAVADTGIGIPHDHLKTIFHEFRQVSEGYGRKYEGSGLGLSITKRIVNIFKGKILVQSTEKLGSTFTILLPVKLEQSLGEELQDIQSEFQQDLLPSIQIKNPKILIVEDSHVNIKLLLCYLNEHYDKVDYTTSAEEALRMIKATQYDAILMDINLGTGMDGLKAAKQIREHENYQTTPIIAVTGYVLSSDKQNLLQGGCTHFLEKPFNQNAVLRVLKNIFSYNGNYNNLHDKLDNNLSL